MTTRGSSASLAVDEEVELGVGEGDDGEAELAEEERALEDGASRISARVTSRLRRLPALRVTSGVLPSSARVTAATLAKPMAALPVLEW